jgi:AcrR family transcriptional regulator
VATNARKRRSRAQESASADQGHTIDLRGGDTRAPDADDAGSAGPEGAGPVVTDGRTARAERTRTAIVDALLGLLEEGELLPTAHRIAERAGISLRLIYHHFGDLESLFRAVSARQLDRMQDLLVPVDTSNPFDRRVADLVLKRISIHERMSAIRRAAMLQEPFSAHLTCAREQSTACERHEVEAVFAPELEPVAAPQHEVAITAIMAALTWGAWNELDVAGRDHDEIVAATTLLIRGVMHELV